MRSSVPSGRLLAAIAAWLAFADIGRELGVKETAPSAKLISGHESTQE